MKIKFYGIEALSLVDLDGMLACTLFTNLCNMRCPFCQNKDLVFNTNLEEIDFEEVLNFLKLRKNMLDAVCITGGEPTLYDNLKEVFKKIKEIGYFIKLDTNGTNPQIIKELYEEHLIDYVAMDIKNSYDKYYETCGNIVVNMDKIQESIDFLKNSGIKYEFRTTVVKELHTEESLLAMAKWLAPCDKLFLQKFVDHGTCIKQGLHEINELQIREILKKMKEIIPNTKLRGY